LRERWKRTWRTRPSNWCGGGGVKGARVASRRQLQTEQGKEAALAYGGNDVVDPCNGFASCNVEVAILVDIKDRRRGWEEVCRPNVASRLKPS
jgi:hypothetical protein